MNIFRLIGELVVIYIIYKLIFSFLIPLYQTTRQMKGKMTEMQERMQQQQRAQAEQQKQKEETARPQNKVSADDYIDYEEIRN